MEALDSEKVVSEAPDAGKVVWRVWPSGLSCPESQQVPPVSEDVWKGLMAPRLAQWKERQAAPGRTPTQRVYASRRVNRLSRPYSERVTKCATTGVAVACKCPGRRDVRWFACRQHLMCERCQRQRSKRLGARIRAGLEAAAAEQKGMMAVMITISVRHTGDIGEDRRALMRGWRRFYKAYTRRFGAFTYVGTHEITPGTDKLGHPHAHIVALWPFRDWGDLYELWRAACPESTRINFKASYGIRAAAKYVSKYISKGVHTAEFSPELRARALAGTYQSRWVMTSVRFWQPFVPVCKCCGERVTRVTVVDPWSAASALAARRGAVPDDTPDDRPSYQLAIETISASDECGGTSRMRCGLGGDKRRRGKARGPARRHRRGVSAAPRDSAADAAAGSGLE